MTMRESMEKGIFWRWGSGMYRFRWVVITIWVALFLSLALFAQRAPELLKDNGFTPRGSQSDQGLLKLQEELGIPASTITLVYQSDNRDLTEPQEIEKIMSSLNEIKRLPYVIDVQINPAARQASKAQSAQGDPANGALNHQGIQSVNISLSLNTNEALDHYPEIKSQIRSPEGMKVQVTGGTAILYDCQQATKKDIEKSEMIGLPITLVVLLIIFGTVLGALLPLIVGLTSVTVTLGITYFIAQGYSLSNFLPNMVTMLGLAVGIDYALFMVSRFREELKRRSDVKEAVAVTCEMAGKSIFFSGVAVLIGMLGMLFIDLTIFRSLCVGGILVVSISVLVANTLLLSLLSVFGYKINAFSVIPSRYRQKESSRFWERISYAVMKQPVILVMLIGAALIYLMIPLGSMKLDVPNAGILPPSYESRLGSDLLDQVYDAREMNPIQIYVHTDQEVWDESSIRAIQTYSDKLVHMTGVKNVSSYVTLLGNLPAEQTALLYKDPQMRRQLENQKLAKNHTAFMQVIPQFHPDDAQTEIVVKQLRNIYSEGLQTLITGGTAYRLDILDRIGKGTPAVVGFVMIVTYFVLLLAFRSVLLPLKAVLMNVLSLGASLGVVVTVFQRGFLADVLHITSIGYVNATMPIIIFCIVFGISMDYEVFLISRIKEEYERTGDNEKSTAEGLKKTGSLITSAAFILIVVVGAFIFTDIEIIKALGLGLSLAVLIDATVIRIIVVPALMKLLGKANWWAPGWVKR
jgi:RND superfamily putative drug exporter